MQVQNQAQPMGTTATTKPMQNQNHGGHELFDAHEALTGLIAMLDQYKLYAQQIQDPELMDIVQRQSAFATQTYNTMVDCFATGQDPKVPTQQYKMKQNNDAQYGLRNSQARMPKTSANELTDQDYSTFMLVQAKSMATALTIASLEMTNPIMRRVLADSVPNFIEMSYEIFLYQNKNGYYQVPQLQEQDMTQLLQSFNPAPIQSH